MTRRAGPIPRSSDVETFSDIAGSGAWNGVSAVRGVRVVAGREGEALMRIRSVWLRHVASLAGLVTLLALLPAAAPASESGGQLPQYAHDTWSSFVAMTDASSGLPADSLSADGTRSVQTSTTNIGAYMWSALVAERLGLITHAETVARLSTTIGTLEHMERYQPGGQFYNWYDHRTGAKLTAWPPTGAPLTPILSSVDNGWLATGLRLVQRSVPELAARAGALFDSMDFGFYYRPGVNRIAFYYAPSTGESPCCYDTIVSESRIASYIGIAKGELPRKHYFGAWRSFPGTCDWNWQETRPLGTSSTYFGVNVFEGAYPYNGTRVTQSWGGSPSNIPEVGYSAYGVAAIAMDPGGYPSNEDKTQRDAGFSGCPGCEP